MTVTDINESPVFTSVNTTTLDENQTDIITVTASTEDNVAKTFAITGGAEKDLVIVNSNTGELVFKEAANFENPLDEDSDNVYEFEMTVTDANNLSSVQLIQVSISNINDAPTAAGETLTTAEDTAIGDSVAGDVNDEDGDVLSYSLAMDVEHGTLTFNATTGDYGYMPAPQFNGTDSFIYKVTDTAGEFTTAEVTITVSPVDDTPMVFLNTNYSTASILDWNTENWAAGQSSSFIVDGVAVNMNFGGTAPYVDISDNTNITGGLGAMEQSLAWTIDPMNKDEMGKLVITFDRPVSNVAFNLLDIDSGNLISSSQMEQLSVRGLFVGEESLVTMTPTNPAAITLNDNIASSVPGTAVANDTNTGNVDVQFTGLVDTIILNYGSQAGANANPSWLDFAISDIRFEKAQMDNTVLFIENEPAVLLSDPSAAVYDMLEDDIVSLTMQFTGLVAESTGSDEIITVLGETFVLDADKSVTVTNASNVELLIDYVASTGMFTVTSPDSVTPLVDEALSELILSMTYQNLDHTPTVLPDNDDRLLSVTTTDSGGLVSETAVVRIIVESINDAPIIESNGGADSATLSVEENQTSVSTVVATDYEENALTFSISGGADSDLFTINPVSGVLSFVSAPNFEALNSDAGNNNYLVEVTVIDDGEDAPSDTQLLTVSVTDVNDDPIITSETVILLAENQVTVGTVESLDQDSADSATYSISGGDDAILFNIDEQTGVVNLVAAADFENPTDTGENNIYEFEVTVTDTTGATDVKLHQVSITDINDAPVITSSTTIEILENQTPVITVLSEDQDALDTATYSLSGGDDVTLFNIDSTTGELKFITAPDFEVPSDSNRDNVYTVEVTVVDAATTSDVEVHSITVQDTQDAPIITSLASASIPENTTAVITVVATDQDANPADTLSFSISGGDDQTLFKIDSVTGELRFIAEPNVEQAADTGGDNTYLIEVSVDDGKGNSTQQLISIEVTDVNDAPIFAEAELQTQTDENQTTVTTIVANDEDLLTTVAIPPTATADILTYSLSGGADSALFDLGASSGILTFKVAPDFENPSDAGTNPNDNIYELEVTVVDGEGGEATQRVHVTVNDIGINFSVRALLQGPYNGTDMSDTLRVKSLIPLLEPYSAMGYTPSGTLTLDSNLLAIEGNDAIVDWVLIEIRDGADQNIIIQSQVALLQRDGDVMMPAGQAELNYDTILAGNYFVSLRHRNHLAVISEKLTLGATHVSVDFADSNFPTQGQHTQLVAGDIALLWAGDANHNGQMIAQGNGNDLNILLGNILGYPANLEVNTNYVLDGYMDSDINLDGKTIFSGSANDVNPIMANILLHPNNISFSANFIIQQQL